MKPLFGSILIVFGMAIVSLSPGIGLITLAAGYWMLEQCSPAQQQLVNDSFVGLFIASMMIYVGARALP